MLSWAVLAVFDLILDAFSLCFLNDSFHSGPAERVALDILLRGVGDSAPVKFVLFSDPSSYLWVAPRFPPWFGGSLVCFDNLLDCELDVVEVLRGCGCCCTLSDCFCECCSDLGGDCIFVLLVAADGEGFVGFISRLYTIAFYLVTA